MALVCFTVIIVLLALEEIIILADSRIKDHGLPDSGLFKSKKRLCLSVMIKPNKLKIAN